MMNSRGSDVTVLLIGAAVALSCDATQRRFGTGGPTAQVIPDAGSEQWTGEGRPAPMSESRTSQECDAGVCFAGGGNAEGPLCLGCDVEGICLAPGETNADNPCEVCDPERNRGGWSANDGVACDDGLFCTVDDVCEAGQCLGDQRQCEDGVACNGLSVCLEVEDSCSTDENQCGEIEFCEVESGECVSTCDGCVVEGVCFGTGASATGNPCLVCDPEVSTTNLTVAEGRACGEGATECSGQDTCNTAGQCVPNHSGEGTLCGFPQGAAQCDAADTCNGNGQCVLRVAQNGSPCDDGQFCTENDQCQGGLCVAGGPRICGTRQSCDEAADQCRCDGCLIGGSCVAAGTVNPGNACQVCNPARSPFGFVANDGVACDDGQFCTVGDQCQGGQCVADGRRDCGDGRSCNEPANACQVIILNPGSPCIDDSQCSIGVCLDFFVDGDGDGFATASSLSSPVRLCGGEDVPGFTDRRPSSPQSSDCLDSDSRAFPGQTSFLAVTVPGLNPPFDWNCDGQVSDELDGANAQGQGAGCPLHYPLTCDGLVWGTDPICGETRFVFTCAIQSGGACDANRDSTGQAIRTNRTTRCN